MLTEHVGLEVDLCAEGGEAAVAALRAGKVVVLVVLCERGAVLKVLESLVAELAELVDFLEVKHQSLVVQIALVTEPAGRVSGPVLAQLVLGRVDLHLALKVGSRLVAQRADIHLVDVGQVGLELFHPRKRRVGPAHGVRAILVRVAIQLGHLPELGPHHR